MNRFFYFLVFAGVISVFGVILYITQGNSFIKSFVSNNNMPTLPPDSSVLKVITPAQPQGQTTQSQQAAGQPTSGVDEPMKASYSATLKTTKGDIQLTLFGDQAPKTVKNFLTKAQSDYYKNMIFHRVEDWVIQGGDPKGDGSGGGEMLTEINTLPFVTGSLGVARRDDIRISNDSQFFITKSDASWLNQQYTNFGIVTKGMDVVNKIQVGDKILGIIIQ